MTTEEVIAELRRWLTYNSHDLGELGKFVRLEYVHQGIDLAVEKLDMNAPARSDDLTQEFSA